MAKKREPYTLPDQDCERLNRTEFTAVKLMLAHLSTAAYWLKDLERRLECIPYGKRRAAAAVGLLRAVNDDVIGTVSKAQAKQLWGTMRDYDLRLVPRATPGTTNIVMTREEGVALMDVAREKCVGCVEDGNSCRNCKLYKFLEATTPLDDYGDGLICPYSLAQWE